MNKIMKFFILDKIQYLLIRFNKKIKGKVIPYKGSIIYLGKNSKISVKNRLSINTNKIRNSKKETYIKIEDNGVLIVKDSFEIYYNGDICIFKNGNLEIGSGFMNAGSQIRCKKRIKIGDNVAISRNVIIWDTDAHDIYYDNKKNERDKEVIIGNNVLIGNGSIILKGTKIGNNVVIGAGSVVKGEVPDNSLVCGNPARVIKKIKGWK